MSKTPYQDLQSVDILSAHISGLQHSINKIEEILGMKKQSAANHPLNPVTDQEDPAARYRIYEGSIRNWLASPAPIVYRNGEEVPASEYVIQPAYGVITFHESQAPSDTITVDMEHIIAADQFSDSLPGLSPVLHFPSYWRTHCLNCAALATNVLIAANLFDAFPFPVTETTTYDAIAINVDTTSAAGTSARLGIYKDNGANFPGELLLDAGEVPTDAAGLQSTAIDLTLERGLYWLVRNSDDGPQISGINRENAISLGMDDSFVGAAAAAYRATYSYGALPASYPSSGTPLFRSSYASVWMRRA
ncbi:hypothetical protein [Alkalihalobacillus sp. AL-G]|uniref:hypothetical protein n=1 Tax=Alkalihalobacillus sp. AL-G TaxID=2926399 RepID=UPI00272CA206|nr:hypothetical protein [Alkalihalobacillus sp. AL-G]WLD92639.1 hypothetical protein MOJ78_16715 [Alkalihalobacillus sp. AL-G]